MILDTDSFAVPEKLVGAEIDVVRPKAGNVGNNRIMRAEIHRDSAVPIDGINVRSPPLHRQLNTASTPASRRKDLLVVKKTGHPERGRPAAVKSFNINEMQVCSACWGSRGKRV
jgi:hypothetical protein